MKFKFTAENPHGQIVIECPICKWNNCKQASFGSEECCWCICVEWGYNLSEPCCFSNWKKEGEIWKHIGKRPRRIREFIRLQRKKLTNFIGESKNE